MTRGFGLRNVLALTLSITSLLAIGCGNGDGGGEGGSTPGEGGSGSGNNGPGSGASSSGSGGKAPSCSKGYPVEAMPLISKGAPAFASEGDATAANAGMPASAWGASSLPAWVGYDISGAPEEQRQGALVSWYAIHSGCYIADPEFDTGGRPLAYAIEVNDAKGGGQPPESGWKAVATVPENRYCGRMHYVALDGANWIRMAVTGGVEGSVAFQLDVQSAPTCASDAWLFMGDSITYMTLTHAFCDLPQLVSAENPDHWPAVIDAAIGGTNTGTALEVIDDTMKDFPGRFVVLAYGTNDHPDGFGMDALVQKVIAAKKTPVVPRLIWADSKPEEGPAINEQIEALYLKYPEILKGPDLWGAFEDHLEWIPSGDVHPNGEGQEELRKQWAAMMASVYE